MDESLPLHMLQMLLKDIPRPREYGNRQSFVLASARYCETLAGWLDAAPVAQPSPQPSDKDAYTRGFSDGWDRCAMAAAKAVGAQWPATDLGATDEDALAIHRTLAARSLPPSGER